MTSSVESQPESARSEEADRPTDIPAKGWTAVGRRVIERVKDDHVTLNAAGVAFFGFLALIPAMVALVSIYGLVGDPDAIEETVEDFAGALPDEARELIVQQLESITATGGGALTLSLILSLVFALWSASSGMSHLVEAVNIAYQQPENRGFVKRRALSLALTLGALLFVAIAVGVIAALPAVLAATDVPDVLRWLIRIAVWPLLGVGLAIGLAVLYRVAPNRDTNARWIWVSPGVAIAVIAWLVASVGFQIYAANFGDYNETYGSLGAIVILLLWLWISALVVLLGATINSETEAETTADTTV